MEDTERGDSCPKLLDLMVPKERDWMMKESERGGKTSFGVQQENNLELKLAPPGLEEPSVLSLGYVPKASKTTKRGFFETVQSKNEGCPPHAATVNAAGANSYSSQPRNTSVPVVGWPPIRSFRKNIASSSKQPVMVSENGGSEKATKPEICKKGLFVKINMDGIPIGRKVDLKAYDSYEKLSSAVEDLFQGLLAAQKDPASVGTHVSAEQSKAFTGLLDGSGEYTLVYEDNEGDRMLVGDVPWEMFVSTAKRLRVLNSSELSTLALGAVSKKRTANKS